MKALGDTATLTRLSPQEARDYQDQEAAKQLEITYIDPDWLEAIAAGFGLRAVKIEPQI